MTESSERENEGSNVLEYKCEEILKEIACGSKKKDEFLLKVFDELWSISRSRNDEFLAKLITKACQKYSDFDLTDSEASDKDSDQESSEDSFEAYNRSFNQKMRSEELTFSTSHYLSLQGKVQSQEQTELELQNLLEVIELSYLNKKDLESSSPTQPAKSLKELDRASYL